jgi:hypothetical protein
MAYFCFRCELVSWLFWIRIRIGNADPDPVALKLTKSNK